jgi:hypothetical protein
LLDAAAGVDHRTAPVLLPPDADPELRVDPAARTSWRRLDPTRLRGTLEVRDRTLLVFSQTFDPRWRLSVDGESVPGTRHLRVNGFANAWLVEGSGTVQWQLSYGPQQRITAGVAGGAGLLALALIALAVSLVRGRRRRG